ncbi:Inorganic pyrophosphatase 1 [Leucoagaricus sp. SymC.cos]|nr:Inorganic pyrophosphatase 1 [Leucoagaricus sp. SymC.cos]
MMSVERQLIVFDFDWSMADQDTDRWIFEVLAPDIRRKMENMEDEIQWTDLVAQSLREAHERGITREQIEHTLRIMPFHPAMVRGVSNLKARGKTTFLCLSNANSVFISTILEERGLETLFHEIITNPAEWITRTNRAHPSYHAFSMVRGVSTLKARGKTTFLCLSNANSVFISTILKEKGLETLFHEIITNPAEWDGELLKLRRRIDPTGPQHSCKVGCSPNMCKGEELTTFLERHGKDFDRIVYVGDGSNDFCPILRLRSQDMILCRRNYGLEKRIVKDAEKEGLKCQAKYWMGAWEVEEIFNTF